jgi:hypothetical protein
MSAPLPSFEEGQSLSPISGKCPHADSWQHADIADSLGMPVGTLLTDTQGAYCPACDFRPDQYPIGAWRRSVEPQSEPERNASPAEPVGRSPLRPFPA